jgi:anti-anti-sigma regulatory factor
VVLDLESVERFDLAGLQLLVLIEREARGAGIGFTISGSSDEVDSVLDISGAGRLLKG